MNNPATPNEVTQSEPTEVKDVDDQTLKRLQQIHTDNIDEIERMEQTLGQKIKANKIEILIKLSLYIIESFLIILLTSPIKSIFWSIFVSILAAFLLTYLIDWGYKKIKKKLTKQTDKEKSLHEVRQDTGRTLVQAIVSQFTVLPPLLKDNVAALCYKGGTAKASVGVRKMRTNKKLLEDFLQARKDFRDMKYNDASVLLKDILKKISKNEELEPLHREVKLLLDATPTLESD